MNIDPTSSLTSPATSSTSTQSTAQTTKDEFLRLLVAQMQYQDPLEPQKGSEFVAQLAQMSSLEQSAETNSRLASLQAGNDSMARTQLAGLVGKKVSAKADSLSVGAAGAAPPLTLHLDAASQKTTVNILDKSGNVIRTMDLGARPAGDVTLPPQALPQGDYTIQIKASGQGGAAVTGNVTMTGTVEALEFQNGNTRLRVGGVTMTPADVLSIQG